jgi:hypothetical protein
LYFKWTDKAAEIYRERLDPWVVDQLVDRLMKGIMEMTGITEIMVEMVPETVTEMVGTAETVVVAGPLIHPRCLADNIGDTVSY